MTAHDCARTSRVWFLGITSCKVCGWTVRKDLQVMVTNRVRNRIDGTTRMANHYYRAIGCHRIFTLQHGFEWTHATRREFLAARREWKRSA